MILKTKEELFKLDNYCRFYITEGVLFKFVIVGTKSGVNTIDTIAGFNNKDRAIRALDTIANQWSDNNITIFDLDKWMAETRNDE